MGHENSSNEEIRVVIADDHEMVREGITQLLEETGWINVVGQAQDGYQALQLAEEKQPDLVILDYTMPHLDGYSALEQFRRTYPKIKIIVLTVHENIHYAVKALQARAHGYVIKAAAVQELVEAIQAVRRGKVYVSPRIGERIAAFVREPSRWEGVEALSQREFEILRFLGKGMSLQECAKSMFISESAASTYRSRLMKKLGLNSTAEIIKFALEHGVVG